MSLQSFFSYVMIIAVVSFLGFWVENIWLCITKGYMNSRGMYFPFLLGYGLAMVGVYAVFGTPQMTRLFGAEIAIENTTLQYLVYYLMLFVCVSAGEILLGKFIEKTCGFCWWDYSRLPLHITQYTSVFTSMAFAALMFIFMYVFFERLYRVFVTWNTAALAIIAIPLLLMMTGDFVNNGIKMYKTGGITYCWHIDLTGSKLFNAAQRMRTRLCGRN